MDADYIIQKLGLIAHPEGGYFRETYRSDLTLAASSLPERYQGNRNAGTAIYFLLTGKTFSAFHRLCSDEIWHYHLGNPVTLHMIHADGSHECIVIGPDIAAGHQLHYMIPANTWFGAKVENPDGFILISCTVAPGFDFHDFELADRTDLIRQFPQHESIITSLTREHP